MRTLIPVITNLTQALFSKDRGDQASSPTDARKHYYPQNRAIEIAVHLSLTACAVWIICRKWLLQEPIFTSDNVLLCVIAVLAAVLAGTVYKGVTKVIRRRTRSGAADSNKGSR